MKNKPNRSLKFALIFLFLIGITTTGYLQSPNTVDSLIQVISNMEDNTEKVDKLLSLSWKLRVDDPNAAMKYCNDAEKLANELNYDSGKLDVLYKKAAIYNAGKSLDTARTFILKHIKLARALDERKSMIKGMYLYADISSELGERDTAIVYLKLALQGSQSLKDSMYFIPIYNELGNTYQNIANYDSAIMYFHRALALSEQTNDQRIGTLFNNMGKVLQLKEEEEHSEGKYDFDEAKKYYYRSLECHKSTHDTAREALVYTNLGNVANIEDHLDSALMFYAIAEPIYIKFNDQKGLSDLLIGKGIVLRKQGHFEKAQKMFATALSYYTEKNIFLGILTAKENMAYTLGFQDRFSDAIALYDTCLRLAIESRDDKYRLKIYERLYILYEGKDKFKQAFYYQSRYNELKDTIYSIKKEKVISELQERYQLKESQAKILEQDLKNNRLANQKNIFLFSGIGSIIILLFIIAYHISASRKNKIIAEQKIKQLEEEKKLLAARSIVVGQEQERKRIAKELHDGLGVLLSTAKMQFTTIKDKSPENRPLIEKAKKLLEQAAGDVRKISHNMMPGLLTRYGFYEAVADLFEQLDDMHGLTANASISGDQKRLPENTEIMLYRIVQEMANNTLKHAEATETQIDIVILPEKLSIDYSDNGKGFDFKQKLANKSIGLTSIQSRVNFLNGNLDVQSKPGEGTNYHITIPKGNRV